MRLDPIINQRLKPTLGPLPWVTILTELDSSKGFVPKTYTAGDLSAQLRMITERLGNLGFPFEKSGNREISTLGSELRIVRNRWAHNDEFSALDSWRTNDFVVRLLEGFTDTEGVALAVKNRAAALNAVVKAEGLMPEPIIIKVAVPETVPPPSSKELDGTEHVRPDPAVLVRSDSTDTPTIGTSRSEFEPWPVVIFGDRSVLDELPKKAAKEQVRSVAIEIAEFEGPIHIERLTKLTTAAFDLSRLYPKRERQVVHQIKQACAQADLTLDENKFVWPSVIDRQTWKEFRPNSSDAERPFWHISPTEIANAACFIAAQNPDISQADLRVQTLRTFGYKRQTKQIREHLDCALLAAKLPLGE
ncbi:MAG: Swt1 family HEPN domain-containing protein [Coriobacteriia bacterium]|nr:Swt1 family HEPN domain-containing protein [Coriobacteriia bacterium]